MAMSSHVTLRGLMGLGDGPAALQDSALIMIDCQNTYRRGVMQLDGAEDAFAEAARMLARARASGIPVFHIMHDAGQGSPYDVTAEIGQISDEVAPIAGEPVIVKNYPSLFFQTDLGAQLEKTGRHDLVLAGFMTHMCVSSTAGRLQPRLPADGRGQHDRHPRAARARRRARARRDVADRHPGRNRGPVRCGGRHARRPPRLTGSARGPGLREGRLAY